MRPRVGVDPATGWASPTREGTGIWDYVHVRHLAEAHVAALECFDAALRDTGTSSTVVNLGTGRGVTVRELVSAFEEVYGAAVPVREAPPRRPGDAVGAYALVDKARDTLGWVAKHDIADGIASALAWAERPQEVLGYE